LGLPCIACGIPRRQNMGRMVLPHVNAARQIWQIAPRALSPFADRALKPSDCGDAARRDSFGSRSLLDDFLNGF
jgi:hypothetical protein